MASLQAHQLAIPNFVAGPDYADRVLAQLPLGYWKLAEGGGSDVLDSSGNGYDGTYTGITWGGEIPPQGGVCPTFDGVNDFANVYSAGLGSAVDLDELTLIAWCKVSSAAVWTDSTQRWLLRPYRDGSNYHIFAKDGISNKMFHLRAGAGINKSNSAAGFTQTDWFCMATSVSIDGGGFLTAGELGWWKDGVEIGARQTGNLASIGSGLTQIRWGDGWDGYLAHAMVFNKPMNSGLLALMTV